MVLKIAHLSSDCPTPGCWQCILFWGIMLPRQCERTIEGNIYSGSNYSNLTRPHPKWWFSKGDPLISGKSRLVTYYNLDRLFQPSIFGCVPGRVKSTGDVSLVDFLVATSMIKHIPNQRPKRVKSTRIFHLQGIAFFVHGICRLDLGNMQTCHCCVKI